MKKTEYEKIRADISKRYKDEVGQLKLEIIRLNEEIIKLHKDKEVLEGEIRRYKSRLDGISDSQKSLLGLSTAFSNLICSGNRGKSLPSV